MGSGRMPGRLGVLPESRQVDPSCLSGVRQLSYEAGDERANMIGYGTGGSITSCSLTPKRVIDSISVGRKADRPRWVMGTVTISPKFQVVIPKPIREKLGLTAGQKVQAIAYEDRIELIPVRPIQQMRGFLKGIDTTVPREGDRV